MANSETTTTTNASPAAGFNFADLDYFVYPAVFKLMADYVKEHNPELFIRCGEAMDTCPTTSLRGLAYLNLLLTSDKDAGETQRSQAGNAIAEFNSLTAALLDMQTEAREMEKSAPPAFAGHQAAQNTADELDDIFDSIEAIDGIARAMLSGKDDCTALAKGIQIITDGLLPKVDSYRSMTAADQG